MADVEKTVGGTGPDYATWTLFEAAIPADITLATGSDEHWIGKGRDVAFNERFIISGIVTDSTNRVTLTYDTGAKHDGRSRDVSSSGVQIHDGSDTYVIIISSVNHVTIGGLDIKHTAASAGAAVACFGTYASGANGITIKNSILHNTGSSSSGYVLGASRTNLDLTVFNTIIYGYSGTLDTRNSASADLDYCTLWRHADQIGIIGDTELTCNNTYSGKAAGSSEDFWTAGAAPSGSHNASSDSTATTDYTSSLINKAGSSQFVNVTAGSEDFTLLSSSDLIGAGTPIGGVTTDIIGTSRDGLTPDIGAFEFISGAILITVDQTETGDSQTATIQSIVSIVASQSETGDATTATIQSIVSIVASQSETGDSPTATIQTVASIAASQTETGDTQAASLVTVLTSALIASQAETGDSQIATLQLVASITVDQPEIGDTQVATIQLVGLANLTADQTEAGDRQAAVLQLIGILAANQSEIGDSQTAALFVGQLSPSLVERSGSNSVILRTGVNRVRII